MCASEQELVQAACAVGVGPGSVPDGLPLPAAPCRRYFGFALKHAQELAETGQDSQQQKARQGLWRCRSSAEPCCCLQGPRTGLCATAPPESCVGAWLTADEAWHSRRQQCPCTVLLLLLQVEMMLLDVLPGGPV